MLNTQDKRDVIYALEEWTKVLEAEGNIAKRNEIMELTWKVSSSLGQKVMTEVKFVYTGYVNIEGTDNSMDTIEAAIESVRSDYGNQVADFAEFTIEGEVK